MDARLGFSTGSVTVRGVRPDDPLWTLKEKVAATLGTAPGAQRLVLGSRVLEPDDAMVANCGLVGASTLQLSANAVVGAVVVVLRNAGKSAVDLAPGDLRVSCATFS